MSASLVGSEMCIRDRCSAGIGAGAPRRTSPPGGLPRSARPPGTPRGRPVSYTHLTLPTICSV
eukprot:14909399-Alexandrium_andersonii.AAC.1